MESTQVRHHGAWNKGKLVGQKAPFKLHLPGLLAAKTTLPVLGVPIPLTHLRGKDSLLSIVQMPRGIPVATFAIGESGAANAALFAIAMLARTDAKLAQKLLAHRARQMASAQATTLPPSAK